jgi:hypothetical protein
MNARRSILMMICVLAGVRALGGAAALAAPKGVVGFFGESGTAGGSFNLPSGVAVNDASGNVYVVDSGNNRVQEFSAGGVFIRAWGLGVVSTGQDSGGTNTMERVVVAGTSGTFTLSLSGDTTGAIAFDAPAGTVEADLNALGSIGGVGGSVGVSGEGTNSRPYEVTFNGSLQGTAVAQMTVGTSGLGVAVGTSLSCVAGPVSATTKTYQWLRNGVAIEGANSSLYTTVAGDEGDVVQCQVFSINANAGSTQVGTARAVVSPVPATAPPVAPASIAKPVIATGVLKVGGAGGATLSCAPGVWTGASTFSYQWYRNGVALSGNGASTSVYTVQSVDLTTAAAFQCAVTGGNAGGSVTLVSANLNEPKPEAPAAPVASATVTVPVLVTVSTTVIGVPAVEVCNAISSPKDVCKAGVAGSVAGAMSAPQGIAVEQVTGDVYVTDQGNRRVDEFTEAGVFVRAFGWGVETGASKPQVCATTCEAGLSGSGAGELGANIGYPAVEPTTGDVYVADPTNMRVQVFEGDGLFARAFGWGVIDGASEFQLCTDVCRAGIASASEVDLGRFANDSPTRVALDASGNVYVVDSGSPDYRVQKFASVSKENAPLAEFFASAQLTGTSSVTAPTDVAVEPAPLGSVLAAREPSSPAEHLVYELGSGGSLLGIDGEGAALPASRGLAVGSSGGNAYFSTATNNRVFVLGALVAPVTTVEAVTGSTASEATLHGTVDPEEAPPNGIETAWQFEYSTNDVEWTTLSPAGEVAASTSPVAVTQTLTGLEGGTVYDVRLHASKEFAAGSATSSTVQFTTSAAAPAVSGEAVSKVADTSAIFSAQINPQHLDTTYHFEYDTVPYTTSTMHGMSLPVPDGDIGAGVNDVPVSQEPRDLKPSTTYHYRVVATSSVEVTDGPERVFRTQATGSAFALPDGRAWEMVSPPDKNGAVLGFLGGEQKGSVIQAAVDGDAFTWTASTAVGPEPAGNIAINWSQIFSVRGADGWSSRDIAPAHDVPSGLGVGVGTEYRFFSLDLSLGLVEPIGIDGVTPLSPEATELTLYLRDDTGNGYLPLVTSANIPPGKKIDGIGPSGEPTRELHFAGAAPDLGHVVLSGPAGLDENYPGVGRNYEWIGGKLRLISVLPGPDGEPTNGNFGRAHGLTDDNVRHAISNDGSSVIWNDGLGGLYMRDMVSGETILLGDGEFQTASDDDHKVFFTSGSDLEVFETTNEKNERLEGALTDLTASLNVGESAGVEGALPGASEDGSYVYLVATGVLSEAANSDHEKPAPGANNLYVLHDTGAGWTTTFIAQLSGEDGHDWAGIDEVGGLERLTARVSPNGRYFAFMSDRELTGYDNHDTNSNAADEEVFLYHAPENPGTEPGSLVCPSCNPAGARPEGVFDEGPTIPGTGVHAELAIDGPEVWGHRWLAANIPGWTSAGVTEAFYQSRYLSDSGRLFFNSSDALVSLDVNGTEDVYEYEPEGDGSESARCGLVAASGSVVFKPARSFEVDGREGEESAGCVGLISSGTSSRESAFLDANESGGDVFFLTAAKLAPQDTDTSMDIYDAHECTAQVPCVSLLASSPECTTADACRVAPTPQPSIFGVPSSSTFSGAGNPTPAPASAPAKAKARVVRRAQKLAEALKECKKKKSKKQRSACERQARKRYGTSKAKKASRRAR